MAETQSKLWFSGVAYIPYAILAYAYNWLTNGTNNDLTIALLVLLGGRLVYGVIDQLTALVAWKVHGRKRAENAFLALMRENHMPRMAHSGSLSSYLSYIDDDSEENSAVRSAARQISTIISQSQHESLMGGNRVERAACAAYDRYQHGAAPPLEKR